MKTAMDKITDHYPTNPEVICWQDGVKQATLVSQFKANEGTW